MFDHSAAPAGPHRWPSETRPLEASDTRRRIGVTRALVALAVALALATAGCDGAEESERESEQAGRAAKPADTASADDARPNILWIVWDTVRADHMSLYGHDRSTTPKLDEWAKGARVYDNAISVAPYTLPSHASMFTGLLPSKHCTNNDNKRLNPGSTTLAELLSGAGYSTYLYSANPNVSESRQMTRGFQVAEHPWDSTYRQEALRIILAKTPPEDASSQLPQRTREAAAGTRPLVPWNIKAAGELAEQALTGWLQGAPADRPYFAFLNYMEAHEPMIPTRKARARMMNEAEIEASYRVDRSRRAVWEYTFGLSDYTDEEIALTRATYDATLTELDDHLSQLLQSLEQSGHLENTVVILTSDHGEHLGEQHMLDHQYSVHESLLRIPLIVHYPARFAPGRDPAPVMNFDVFPTLLELAGVEPPASQPIQSISLLATEHDRVRLAEDPSGSTMGMKLVTASHPDWDPSLWQRKQRALLVGDHKYIWSSRGEPSLYDLGTDAWETHDLIAASEEHAAVAARLQALLDERHAPLVDCKPGDESAEPDVSEQEREMLRALGYLDDEPEEPQGSEQTSGE